METVQNLADQSLLRVTALLWKIVAQQPFPKKPGDGRERSGSGRLFGGPLNRGGCCVTITASWNHRRICAFTEASMATRKQDYGNESISALKGADRVRKRPASSLAPTGWTAASTRCSRSLQRHRRGARGLRQAHHVTRFRRQLHPGGGQRPRLPGGLEPQGEALQLGAGVLRAVRRRQVQQQPGGNYEYSSALNGLGSCATQYASEYMDVTVWRDGNEYPAL